MTTQDWHPTSAIHMAIQSAELHLLGFKSSAELQLTCSLINIARGHSVVTIRALPGDSIAASGQVEIPVDRPIMRVSAHLAAPAFDRLRQALGNPSPRPITLITVLNDTLMVNTAGDLLVNQPITAGLDDLSWIIPLQ